MPLAIPPELKRIAPFIRRAEELDRDQTRPESRLFAYYLRQYAVQIGIPLSSQTPPSGKICLGHVLESLEAEHAAMNNFTREEAALICRQFCQQVFDKADGQDRMGLANQDTAKTFYAASTFLQALEQFGAADEEAQQAADDKKKIIYCKWKATEILKALKEGRQPKPGGYEQDELLEEEETGDDQEDDDDDDDEEKQNDDPEIMEHANVERVLTAEDQGDKMETGSAKPVEDDTAAEDGGLEEEHAEGEGLEVDLHLGPTPPPAYPGPPPMTIDFDPAMEPLPPPTLHVPPPVAAAPAPPAKKKTSSLFGFASNKKGKAASKAQLDDAIELANFALAALNDKDTDLAAERFQQALAALGR